MKKLILASVSAIALFGIAACSDTDTTTTRSVDAPVTTTVPADPTIKTTPEATPTAPSDSSTIKPAEPAPSN